MAPSPSLAPNFLVMFFFYLLFLLSHYSVAQKKQQQQEEDNSTENSHPVSPQQQQFDPRFNPSMAVLIVVLMTAFFFVAFFSIYIRQCGGRGSIAQQGGTPRARRAARGGIDPSLIERLPTLLYSDVKGHRIGKHDSPLECAVCLSDFADSDLLRLIPHCSHAFHPDCIDLWLSSHSTCPVCRHDLSSFSSEDDVAAASVHIDDDDPSSFDPPPPPPAPPAHPHPPLEVWGEEERERRFTLRLPEHVRRDVMDGRLNRSVSMVAFPVGVGDGSMRRGERGGGGSSRGGRRRQQVWAVKSDRWAFLSRTLTWPKREDRSIKRGGEGSVGREGSCNGHGIRSPLHCLGGNNGSTGKEEKDLEQQQQEEDEVSTTNRGGAGGSQV